MVDSTDRGKADPPERIPTVLLAGSDGKPGRLPPGAACGAALSGYKGADLWIEGVPLARNVQQRLEASGAFGPVYVAGPARLFRKLCPGAHTIDTDADFGTNIERALDVVDSRHPGSPVAFITCDVLPTPQELRELARGIHAAAPCDLWFPLVRVRDRGELGASGWKPVYRIVPRGARQPVTVLGGHLVVAGPRALRIGFLRRVFRHAYATRNRPLGYRTLVVVGAMLSALLGEDLRRLARARVPSVTWRTLFAGVVAARRLSRGRLTIPQLERTLAEVLIDHERIRSHGRRVRVALVDVLSLALDIDTEAEAHAWQAVEAR